MQVAHSTSLLLEQPGDTGAQGILSVFHFPQVLAGPGARGLTLENRCSSLVLPEDSSPAAVVL